MRARLRFSLFALILCAVGAQAQTAWPAYMPSMLHGVSESPVAAELPADIGVSAPEAAVPRERARFSGRWHGWACGNMACDVRIVMERVTAEGATLNYAAANARQGLINDRVESSFVGDELHARMRTGNKLVLRLRADGDMEMSLWDPGEQLLSAGVLSQKPAPYARNVQRLPTPFSENGQPVELEMVVYRPPGPGPFPTVILNHGSTGNGDKPELFKQTWTSGQVGRYFVARGWQVLFPQRRGRGQSGGLYDEGFAPDRSGYTCSAEISLAGLDRALADLDAVMARVRTLPDVDQRRLLIGGVSRGGILSVAYAGAHPEAFLGVVNFVGGWIGDRCPTATRVNTTAFKRGAPFPRPELWLYGDRDSFYSLRHSRANHQAFVDAGGRATFLTYELPAGQNGHFVAAYPDLWRPALERYLAEVAP